VRVVPFAVPRPDEETCIPAEHPFIEIAEHGVSTEILLAEPLDESIKLAGSIRAIVAALTGLTFALVAEEWVNKICDGCALLAGATIVCVRFRLRCGV
jgi:hypothetical protein